MGDVLGQIFPYAIGVALSPLPLIGVLLVLRSPAGRSAGAAFLLARLAIVLVVSFGAALLTEIIPEPSGISAPGAIVRIILGCGLMAAAAVKWTRRPKAGDDASVPKWMSTLEGTTIPGAARLGAALTVLNLKELTFGIGAGLTIGSAEIGIGASVLVAALYSAIACAGVILAVIASWSGQARVQSELDNARTWLVRNNAVIVGAVLLIVGAILIGSGIGNLNGR